VKPKPGRRGGPSQVKKANPGVEKKRSEKKKNYQKKKGVKSFGPKLTGFYIKVFSGTVDNLHTFCQQNLADLNKEESGKDGIPFRLIERKRGPAK